MPKEKATATFKIGGDEIRFEASLEAVEARVEKALDRLLDRGIAAGQIPIAIESSAVATSATASEASPSIDPAPPIVSDAELFDQFFEVTTEGQLVMRLVPKPPGDVLLLVLFGICKTQDSPWATAPMMVKTARAAGARFERADRVLAKRPKLVQSTGQARAKRYRLTSEGEQYCRGLVRRLLGAEEG